MLKSCLKRLDGAEPVNYPLCILLAAAFSATNLSFLHALYPAARESVALAMAGVEFRFLFFSLEFFAIQHVLRKLSLRKPLFVMNLAAIFAVAFAHVTFIFYTVTGMTIATVVDMIRQEGHGFMMMVRDAGISQTKLALMILLVAAATALAAAVAAWTERLSLKRPLRLRMIHIACLGLAAMALLIAEQKASPRAKGAKPWADEIQRLPFYVLMQRPPQNGRASTLVRLKPFRRADLDAASSSVVPSRPLGDATVIWIVMETFRKDLLTPEITPNLSRFASESLRFTHSMAGANATHEAWYAILDSGLPLYWNAYRELADMRGSPPFLLLKNAGFKHQAFPSSDITYFNYNTIIYGPPDSIASLHYRDNAIGVPENDRRAFSALTQEISEHRSGKNMYMVLMESGHHPYFWPADFKPKFLPVVPDFDYTKTSYSTDDVDKIRNRDKNALNFEDHLFGELVANLKKQHLYDNAVIVVCGDHGEEFMEHGVLVHSSKLDREQTETPILFKFPGVRPELRDAAMSQLDMLPTLLDYLGLYNDRTSGLMGGKSVLKSGSVSYAVTAAVRGALIPTQYSLTDGVYKLLFSLNMDEHLDANLLTVDDIVDMDDRSYTPPDPSREGLRRFIEQRFGAALRRSGMFESVAPF